METARTRIVNVKPKFALIQLDKAQNSRTISYVQEKLKQTIEAHSDNGGFVAGFAFVIWDKDGSSTANAGNLHGNIPSILIPDFVRNRLLASVIEKWTRDAVNESFGLPPSAS
jgi:hypothetical protein